jgi:hypothetical protein
LWRADSLSKVSYHLSIVHNFIINSEWEQAKEPNPLWKKKKKKEEKEEEKKKKKKKYVVFHRPSVRLSCS